MKKLFILLFILSNLSFAKLKIITTTPDLHWVVKSIGQDLVDVTSLLDGTEDPHHVDAMPHWIPKVAHADILCYVGLELEIGWLPKILQKSANTKIQAKSQGDCNVGTFIKALDIPTEKINRSMGDVHSSGNPHYHLGPSFMIQAADGIYEIIIKNDPQNTSKYLKNLNLLKQKLRRIKSEVSEILKKKKNLLLMTYHKEFSYFIRDFNINFKGNIENVPGVAPSAGQIAKTALQAKKDLISIVIASNHSPDNVLNRFKEISDIPFKKVPTSIQPQRGPKTYKELILKIAKSIIGEI